MLSRIFCRTPFVRPATRLPLTADIFVGCKVFETCTVRLHCLFCCIAGHFQYISASSGKVGLVFNGYFVAFRYLMLLEFSLEWSLEWSLFPVWKPFRNKANLFTCDSSQISFCILLHTNETEHRIVLLIIVKRGKYRKPLGLKCAILSATKLLWKVETCRLEWLHCMDP